MKIREKMEIAEWDNLQEEEIRHRKSTLDGRLPQICTERMVFTLRAVTGQMPNPSVEEAGGYQPN